MCLHSNGTHQACCLKCPHSGVSCMFKHLQKPVDSVTHRLTAIFLGPCCCHVWSKCSCIQCNRSEVHLRNVDLVGFVNCLHTLITARCPLPSRMWQSQKVSHIYHCSQLKLQMTLDVLVAMILRKRPIILGAISWLSSMNGSTLLNDKRSRWNSFHKDHQRVLETDFTP